MATASRFGAQSAQSMANTSLSCPICFDLIVDAVETNCGHAFCSNCAEAATARLGGRCAICRQRVDDIHPSYSLRSLAGIVHEASDDFDLASYIADRSWPKTFFATVPPPRWSKSTTDNLPPVPPTTLTPNSPSILRAHYLKPPSLQAFPAVELNSKPPGVGGPNSKRLFKRPTQRPVPLPPVGDLTIPEGHNNLIAFAVPECAWDSAITPGTAWSDSLPAMPIGSEARLNHHEWFAVMTGVQSIIGHHMIRSKWKRGMLWASLGGAAVMHKQGRSARHAVAAFLEAVNISTFLRQGIRFSVGKRSKSSAALHPYAVRVSVEISRAGRDVETRVKALQDQILEQAKELERLRSAAVISPELPSTTPGSVSASSASGVMMSMPHEVDRSALVTPPPRPPVDDPATWVLSAASNAEPWSTPTTPRDLTSSGNADFISESSYDSEEIFGESEDESGAESEDDEDNNDEADAVEDDYPTPSGLTFSALYALPEALPARPASYSSAEEPDARSNASSSSSSSAESSGNDSLGSN